MQPSSQEPSALYHIADWAVDTDSDRLINGDQTIKLEPKIMKVLLCLIEHQGQIVSKDSLMETVWPEVIITEHPLNRSISQLRKVFQDDPCAPRVIETIPKKGYRLICPVKSRANSGSNAIPNEGPAHKLAGAAVRHRSWASTSKFLIAALCFIALIAVVRFFSIDRLSQPRELYAGRNAIPLTFSLGMESGVAFSPDNQNVVYSHQSPDSPQWDLYLKKIGGTETRLTNTPFWERNACFTPDGSAVTYVEEKDGDSRIVTLSLKDRSLTEVLVEVGKMIIGLKWAPDGKTLVYAARTLADNPYALFLFSSKTGKKKQLTSPEASYYADRCPVFSPDGKWLVFARLDSRYNDDLYIMSTANWQVRRLTHANEIIFGLDWSPLTNEIIYCVYDNGFYRLKSVNLQGKTRPLKVSYSASLGTFPAISPSGTLLSYEHLTLRKNIYKADINRPAEALENVETVVTSSVAEWNAKLSPDGRKIVFVSDRSGSNELWISNLDGSDLRKVLDRTVPYNCMASWAPDSRSFVFAVKPSEAYLTYRYKMESGSMELLASDASAPMHSRNGDWIYFSSMRSGDWRIWKIPVSGGPAIQVTQTNGFAAMESVDGSTLFYCKRGIRGIWKKTAEAKEELVIEDLEIFETQNWLVVEDGIYYFKRHRNRFAELLFYRFADKSTIPLAHPFLKKHRLDDGLSLSPSGHEIYFSLNDHAESDLKMIELALE